MYIPLLNNTAGLLLNLQVLVKLYEFDSLKRIGSESFILIPEQLTHHFLVNQTHADYNLLCYIDLYTVFSNWLAVWHHIMSTIIYIYKK